MRTDQERSGRIDQVEELPEGFEPAMKGGLALVSEAKRVVEAPAAFTANLLGPFRLSSDRISLSLGRMGEAEVAVSPLWHGRSLGVDGVPPPGSCRECREEWPVSATPPTVTAPISKMMQQYQEAEQRHPGMLLLFHVGDFYQTFYEDAEVISRVLNITLTAREGTIPLAGFPVRALETHLATLLRAGHRVAICDQVEDAAVAKGLVRREVTRVVTPGTLTEDNLLDPPGQPPGRRDGCRLDRPDRAGLGRSVHGSVPRRRRAARPPARPVGPAGSLRMPLRRETPGRRDRQAAGTGPGRPARYELWRPGPTGTSTAPRPGRCCSTTSASVPWPGSVSRTTTSV